MNADALLHSLRTLPKPRLSPFFAARVVSECGGNAAAFKAAQTRRTPRVLWIYWLLLSFFAGSVLLQSWIGVAAIVIAAGVAALVPSASNSSILRDISASDRRVGV